MVKQALNPELRERYPHLGEMGLALVEAPDNDRITFIEEKAKDGIWLGYPTGNRVVGDLERLFHAKKSPRPACRFLLAPSNHGNS